MAEAVGNVKLKLARSNLQYLPGLARLNLSEYLSDLLIEVQGLLEAMGFLNHHKPQAIYRRMRPAQLFNQCFIFIRPPSPPGCGPESVNGLQ